MNKCLKLARLLVIFSIAALAGLRSFAETPPFQTELGFKKLSDSSTPDWLKQSVASVFEVRMLSEQKVEDLKVVDLTDPKFANIEQKILGIPQLDDHEKIVINKQIEHCRKSGNEKKCTLFFTIEKATGFIAGKDGQTFWTNAHVTNRFLTLRASLQKTSIENILKTDGRLPMFLFDVNGNLVYDPFNDIATIAAYDPPSTLAALQGNWFAEDTDYVMIKLAKPVGVPLKFGAKPSAGQILYRPGFSACTGCADNPNQTDPLDNNDRGVGKNSDGKGLYWTSGAAQPPSILNEYLGVDSATLGMFNLNQMIFFSADAQVGFSGSPILNENGEVIGIFAGSKPKLYGDTLLNLSRGVRPSIFQQLEN